VDIRLLETAKEDLREGWNFYEQNAAGLGDYFLDCMQADVRSLKVFAGIDLGLPTRSRMDCQTPGFVANQAMNRSARKAVL
jgi:hypothetical protein